MPNSNLNTLEKRLMAYEGENKNDEGQHEAYLDSKGILTVGYGHRVLDSDNLKLGDTISVEQAQRFFSNDVAKARSEARLVVSNYSTLPVDAQDILTEMVFQMGLEGTKKFQRMRTALTVGPTPDFGIASDEMLDSKWAREDSPRRARDLARRMRRLSE
jgi:lysozyme